MSIKAVFFLFFLQCSMGKKQKQKQKNSPTRLAAFIFYIFGCCGFQAKI